MSDRFLKLMAAAASVVALVLLVQAPVAGQVPEGATKRTPWGDPDLQGVYTFATPTPLTFSTITNRYQNHRVDSRKSAPISSCS